MRKGGGREKGFRFERDIARVLGEWWCGDEKALWRNTNSGARATVVGRVYGGDIIPANASAGHWPLCVELKKTESWSFDAFLHGNPGNELLAFMMQCLYAASIGCNKIPMLICSKNRKSPLCLLMKSGMTTSLINVRRVPVVSRLRWCSDVPDVLLRRYPVRQPLPSFYVLTFEHFLTHFHREDFL